MQSKSKRASWFGVLVVATLVAEIGLLAGYYLHKSYSLGGYGFPLDDSWIHATFARNMAEGKGFVYNPGEPVASTTVLYTLLLAALYKAHVAPVFDAAVLGLVLHMGAALLVYGIIGVLGLNRWVAAAGALLFAAVPRLVWGALGGMEIPLYVFLVSLGVYSHLRFRWNDGARAYAATASFALATLARPECAALLIASLADRAYSAWRVPGAKGGLGSFALRVPLHLAVFGAIVLPAVLFNLSYSGKPLPPAFYAKTANLTLDGGNALLMRLQVLAMFLWQAILVSVCDNVVLAGGAAVGFVTCIARSRRPDGGGSAFLPLAFVTVPAATSLCALTTAVGPQLLGQNGRYSAYLVPLVVAMGMLGWNTVARRVYRVGGGSCRGYWTVGVLAVVAALAFSALGNKSTASLYGLQVQNVNSMQVYLGKWAAHLPRDAVLAVNDAGAIAYFSRRRIIDTVGVVNPDVVPYLRKYPDPQKGLLDYLRQTKPDYVIIFPNWYPDLAVMAGFDEPVQSAFVDPNVACGGSDMLVYRTNWRRR
jgi:arabinofuranosyltransferase